MSKHLHKFFELSLINIVTMKANQWVSSAFDGFDDFGKSTKDEDDDVCIIKECRGRKRPRQDYQSSVKVQKRKNVKDDLLWAEKYTPKSVDDLAVHKKKVADVESWLEPNITRNNNKQCPMALLTGPAGIGKTACIQVLAKKHRLEVQEWSNPVTDVYDDSKSFNPSHSEYSSYTSQSQTSLFQDFLFKANRYPTLQLGSDSNSTDRKLILIEEFPNIFFRDVRVFHDILRKYLSTGKKPLVFVISDSVSGESNERLLFPKDLQIELGITNISFNPVAQTMTTKVLTKIATKEANEGAHKFPVPSKDTLDMLATSSNGDIRSAINSLQFACLRDTRDLMKKSTSKPSKGKKSQTAEKSKGKKDKSSNVLSSLGCKDTSLFLFRALGKILYCKRSDSEPSEPSLPSHLSHHQRAPLAINPEEVVEKSHLSGDFFASYLHQNYLQFYSDVDDVVRASEYLSDSDFLTVDWTSRAVMREYASCVSTRGLLQSNSARAQGTSKSLGWLPLHKSQWFSSMKKARENKAAAKRLFKGHFWTPQELTTELVPYLSLTNATLLVPGQVRLVQELTMFTASKYSGRYQEKLDEKDIDLEQLAGDSQNVGGQSLENQKIYGVIEGTDDNLTNSQQTKMATDSQSQYDDDLVDIDDFDE